VVFVGHGLGGVILKLVRISYLIDGTSLLEVLTYEEALDYGIQEDAFRSRIASVLLLSTPHRPVSEPSGTLTKGLKYMLRLARRSSPTRKEEKELAIMFRQLAGKYPAAGKDLRIFTAYEIRETRIPRWGWFPKEAIV
jgi:hypothetical protein